MSGSPFMAASTGYVTKRSTSTAPRPGDLVRIWTCTVVMSGTASMGSPDNAYSPATTSRIAAIRTMGRRARLPSMMRCSMASVLVRERRLGELGLQDEAPLGHDLFSRLHAREDLRESLERVAGLD